MKYPCLHVYVDAESSLCFAKIERPGEASKLMIDVTLEEFQECTPDELQEKIGATVASFLRIWHKELFATPDPY